MTACAPACSTSIARSTVRMPPPMRHGSRRQMDLASARLLALPMAASRSMSCTFGKREKRWIHSSVSSVWMASFSPWTSWTMWPFWRSIEGISMW